MRGTWMGHALPAASAVLLMGSAALPSGAGGGAPTPLRIKYRLGEVSKYQTNMSVIMAGAGGPRGGQGAGMPMQQLSVLQEFRTTRLLPNGSAEVVITTKNMQGGAGMGSALPRPVTLVMDSRGAIVSTKGAPAASGPGMFSNMLGSNALGTQQIPLPQKAVKPGDIWANSFTMPGMGAGTVKGKFVKVEAVGKRRTALLHYLVNIPVKIMMDAAMQPTKSAAAAQMTMSGSVLMNVDNDIDLNGGHLVRSAGNGSMSITVGSKMAPHPGAPRSAGPAGAVPRAMTVNLRVTLGATLVD